MNELAIRVNYDSDRPTVLGRELHGFLGVETPYDKWLPRMCEYGFTDGADYSTFLSDRSDGLPGKPRTDHQLTLEMAKELCMLQRTDRGKQCRQYFIELERQWNTPEAVMSRAHGMDAGRNLWVGWPSGMRGIRNPFIVPGQEDETWVRFGRLWG